MSVTEAAAQAAIGAATRELHLPTVRDQATRLAEIAVRERHTHLGFLAEVLSAEVDDRTERRRARRVAEARFPRLKRLSEFNVDAVPAINAAQLAALAAGGFMDAGEPIVLLGDSGTGKTHLLIGRGLAACEQGRRVRYVTTAQLVNELVEAGFVSLEDNPHHRRAKLVCLTPHGREVFARIDALQRPWVDDLATGLDAEKIAIAADVLQTLQARLLQGPQDV